MRFATLGLLHEANTFSPLVADQQMFNDGGVWRGAEIIEQYGGSAATLGGFLAGGEQFGVDVVPLLFAFVNPVGPITKDAFESLVGEMLSELVDQGPWDGVLLALHGAAVAEHIPDADAEIANRIRHIVGPDVPVGAVLDLHANVSRRLVNALTVTLVYHTNPHVDARERGIECTELVRRAAREEIRPEQVLIPLPLVVNIARQDTSESPMAELMAKAAEIARQPGMLTANVVEGFPYADVPHMGMSCLAIHDGDRLEATSAARELAAAVWRCRAELQAHGSSVDDALDIAEVEQRGPVVLLDVGDNIGGGAPGDSTVILAAAVQRGVRSLVQTLWDPDAVQHCLDAGIGADVQLKVGARHSYSAGSPVAVTGQIKVISDGRFEEPTATHGGFRFFDMGPSVALETTDGHTLVLTTRPVMNSSLRQLLSLGVDPNEFRVVVAKGVNSPRAAYEPIASRLVVVDTDGITAMGVERFIYNERRRPLYPFEAAAFPA
ncbi:MAG: MlrC domain protein [Pseudonocardiaceae bacterium]|nr:MlrC domain protein [Pseudonocardiaceae bacterium]